MKTAITQIMVLVVGLVVVVGTLAVIGFGVTGLSVMRRKRSA